MSANVYRINLLNERVYETNQLSELEFALRTERIREENLLYRDEYLNIYTTSSSNDTEASLQATSFVYNGVLYPDPVSNDIVDINSSLDVFNCDLNKQESTQQLSLVGLLCILIVVTVIGNTLIILAVLTTRRLRTVTNCFVMSLAVADWLVGIFVMPPAVAYNLMGRWELGWILCDIWISLDILLCTASILSLCAISVDRYLAVTRPLTYSRRRRSKKLALSMILAVWVAAGAITCPPMFGWYDPAHNICGECRYNQNLGYVVFSAMGSFFLPLAVMVYVYARIGWVVARRHLQLTSSVTKDSHKRSSNVTCVRSESDSGSVDRTSTRLNHGTITISNSSKCLTHSVNQNEHNTCDCQEYSPCCVTLASGDRKSCHSTRKFRYSMKNHLSVEKRDSFRKSSTDEVNFKSSHRNKFTIRSRPNSYRDANSETNKVSSLRRETKTAKTVSIVVGGFVICWLPFFVYYIVIPFIPEEDSVLMSFLTWLGWFNSAINPFIYAFYSKEFRLAFWRLTIKKCVRGSR